MRLEIENTSFSFDDEYGRWNAQYQGAEESYETDVPILLITGRQKITDDNQNFPYHYEYTTQSVQGTVTSRPAIT